MGVTAVERAERFSTIKTLLDEGYSDVQISEKMNMALPIVKRQIRQLDEMSKSVISIEEMHKTLLEVDAELLEAISEAKRLFEKVKDGSQHSAIRNYLQLWVDTAVKRAALYGLDKVKQDALIQVNTQNNYLESSDVKFSASTLDKVAAEIIRQKSCQTQDEE